jgi:hypothetical protein
MDYRFSLTPRLLLLACLSLLTLLVLAFLLGIQLGHRLAPVPAAAAPVMPAAQAAPSAAKPASAGRAGGPEGRP